MKIMGVTFLALLEPRLPRIVGRVVLGGQRVQEKAADTTA